MKSCKSFGLIVLTLAIGFLMITCGSPSDGGGGNHDNSGTGSNTGDTGGDNNSSGGSGISGMYYREFDYNVNYIQFNNNGTYTWTYSMGTETGAYTVSDNKINIKNYTFIIYNSDTLTIESTGDYSSFPITFLKDGSFYPVSGTYSATIGMSGSRVYWTFDNDGTCALDSNPNSGKNSFKWSYSISGRTISTIYMPSNSPSSNYNFVTINSNSIKDDKNGYLWTKQ